MGLVLEGRGVAALVLRNLGLDVDRIRSEIQSRIPSGERTEVKGGGQLPFTPRAKDALVLSMEESTHLGHHYIGTEHLLLALLRQKDGVAGDVLDALGLERENVRGEILRLLGESTDGPTRVANPVLGEMPEWILQIANLKSTVRDLQEAVESLSSEIHALRSRLERLESQPDSDD
jgi:ATP-dependent Clp protease ATP-binding subunit ClpA